LKIERNTLKLPKIKTQKISNDSLVFNSINNADKVVFYTGNEMFKTINKIKNSKGIKIKLPKNTTLER